MNLLENREEPTSKINGTRKGIALKRVTFTSEEHFATNFMKIGRTVPLVHFTMAAANFLTVVKIEKY